MEPLLVIDDILVMDRGLILLPPVRRVGLPIVAGDVLELCSKDGREEAVVLGIDPDPRDATLVRIRIGHTIHACRGIEVWPSEACSRVVVKRPDGAHRSRRQPRDEAGARIGAGEHVLLSGAIARK